MEPSSSVTEYKIYHKHFILNLCNFGHHFCTLQVYRTRHRVLDNNTNIYLVTLVRPRLFSVPEINKVFQYFFIKPNLDKDRLHLDLIILISDSGCMLRYIAGDGLATRHY